MYKKVKKKLTKKRTTIEATKYWQLILKKDMTSALKNKTGRQTKQQKYLKKKLL